MTNEKLDPNRQWESDLEDRMGKAQPSSNSLLTLLEECESFVDRHSESWYRSGQELLTQIREAKARLAPEPRARDADLYEWVSALVEALKLAGKSGDHDADYIAELYSRLAQPPRVDDTGMLIDLLEQCRGFLYDDSGTPIAPMELRERVRVALTRHALTKEV